MEQPTTKKLWIGWHTQGSNKDKWCMKVNNNDFTAKKKGEEGYDLIYKYDFIWSVLFYNVNSMT